MLEGIKQTLLVMGSNLALIVVGWEIYLLLTLGCIRSSLFGVTGPVFVIVGLGLFKLARDCVAK